MFSKWRSVRMSTKVEDTNTRTSSQVLSWEDTRGEPPPLEKPPPLEEKPPPLLLINEALVWDWKREVGSIESPNDPQMILKV